MRDILPRPTAVWEAHYKCIRGDLAEHKEDASDGEKSIP